MFSILNLFFAIASMFVNLLLFWKIHRRNDINSVFNRSQSLLFLYLGIVAPLTFFVHYLVTASKQEFYPYLIDPLRTEEIESVRQIHQYACWLSFYIRPLTRVPCMALLFCTLVYRSVYVTLASFGLHKNISLSNRLFFIFIFFFLFFQILLFVVSASIYDGDDSSMVPYLRICMLAGLEYNKSDSNPFKENFLKPMLMKLVFISLESSFAIFCKIKTDKYVQAMFPKGKFSALGGSYRRNFQTFYENSWRSYC